MIEYTDLLRKGFGKQEAQETMEIIRNAEENKSYKVRFLDSTIYWVLLVVAIIGNLIISIILIPFLLAFRKIPLYFTIIVLAGMFGFLFDQLIKDIENLESKHHILAWVFIPAFAIINTYYMTSFTNHLTQTLKLPVTTYSPIFISVIYVIAFIIPYIVDNLLEISSRY